MPLPPDLAQAIQQEIENTDRTQLARAAEDLTKQYKSERFSSPPVIRTPAHRSAYLAVRLPATFAANLHVFSEIRRLVPQMQPSTMLDLGSGTGTALHAAVETFPSLTRATMVENDASLIQLGKRLSAASSHPVVRNAVWLQQDINALSSGPHDLVVISYTLGELPQGAAEKIVSQAWLYTKGVLAIIEPGTVRGFAFIHTARSALIAAGAHLLAPCPHAGQCPMAAADDWCHFAARVERTSIHRQLKGGVLGHEDEKFSYVVASRESLPSARARIVRHPRKHSGHVQLTLCTPQGLSSPTIGKSQKEKYKAARKAEWGDAWSYDDF
jgi:ribosomal protein RSM22 (predicted rRNA methylase)